ncbi:MAG: aspartyl/asparaginyl beta-hydroxylase domain-containing protein [Pseudomonadota bacterium]
MELSRPFVRLPYNFDAERLKHELEQLEPGLWMQHPSRVNGNSAVPLVSLNGRDNDDFSGQMLPTPHLKRCEYMQQVMASFGEVLARSRLMKLAAGAQVTPHVDFNYHWYNRVRIHIPIVTNPEVIFYCGDEQRHMQAGECWIFDSWREHNVINSSDQDRVHLVIDTAGSSRFWQTVRKAEQFDEAAQEFELRPYVDGQTPELATERFNVLPVMSPGELEAIARELVADFSANTNNDPDIVNEYRELLDDLAKDWREVWHQYGIRKQGFPRYQTLLKRTMSQLRPEPRALVTHSNNVGVNPIIVQRILRAALFPQQRDAYLMD